MTDNENTSHKSWYPLLIYVESQPFPFQTITFVAVPNFPLILFLET